MNLIDIKESLEPENIREILNSYGVEPVREDTNYFIYPTVCHNIAGGSPKLYYYFDSKLFVCYTECNDSFNIFELIQKMELLRGNKITIFEAAEQMGLGSAEFRRKTFEEIESEKASRFIQNALTKVAAPAMEYEALQNEILSNFSYNREYLTPWINEGISENVMKQFDIGYSIKDVAIAIPHKNSDGAIIGVRGRFMSPDSPNKYMPLSLNGKLLTHSLRGNLYGLYENKENIKNKGRVVLYEGEKSVLHHGSLFGQENNISVATSGNRVSNEQINLLIECGVQEVILAFDQDFKSPFERDSLVANYITIAERLKQYFTVAIIIDWDQDVEYKDSPIDKGKEVFNKLYSNRFYV